MEWFLFRTAWLGRRPRVLMHGFSESRVARNVPRLLFVPLIRPFNFTEGSTTAYRHASAAPSAPETDPDRKRRRQPKRRRRRGQRKRLVTLPGFFFFFFLVAYRCRNGTTLTTSCPYDVCGSWFRAAYTKDPARRAILFPTMEGDALEAHRAAAWEFWEGIGAPKNIVAPMVKVGAFSCLCVCVCGVCVCRVPGVTARLFPTHRSSRFCSICVHSGV